MTLRPIRPRLALFASVSAIFLFCAMPPAAAALPPAGGGSSNAAVAQLVSDAQKAMKAGKLPLAVIDLKNASSADPRNGRVRAQLGAVLLQTGDYYAAERELRQARKDGASDQLVMPFLFQTMLARSEEQTLLDEFPEPNAPSNMAPDILKARAMAFLNLGQSADAIEAMDKSLKLRRDALGLLMRARIAEKAHALPSALQFANEAIAMTPDKVDGPFFKVGLLLDSNDLNGALGLADQLVTKFPANLGAQFVRVEVLMRMNRTDQAKAAVDAVLAKNPGVNMGIYYRALLISRAGNNRGAWRIAQSLPEELLRSQPGIALTVSQMADASGNVETAAAILNGAIGRFPQNAELRLRLATMRVRQNDIHGALNAIEPLKDKLDPTIAQTLAALYVKSSRASEALDVLKKLSQLGKATDASTLQLVALEGQMGQPDQALKDLTSAVNQNPTDTVLVNPLIIALIAHGRFADALSVADKVGSDPAQRATSLVLRGQVLLAERKFDDALASYAKAMQIDPKSQIALYGHADILEHMQKFNDATKDIHGILDLNPRNVLAYLKLAEIAARQQQDGQVRSILTQAIKLSPQDPAPRLSLARYLVVRHDHAGALNAVNGLLKVHPDYAEGLAMLGGIQLSMGKKADAVGTFRRLVKLAPRAPDPQILLGNALFVDGDPAGANGALKNAVNLASASSEVRLAQINLLLAEKDINGALAAAQAYRNANHSTQADILLGDTLTRAGRSDQAMTVYKKSFAASPNSMTLLKIAGNSVADGDTKSAVEVLSSWVSKNPNDNVVRMEYATLLMRQGNNSDSIRQFREVLKRDSNNVVSLNNLAWLTQNQDPIGAMALATRAAALAPNSSDVLDTLGWIKLKHGKAAESLLLLQRAHALRPQDGEFSYHLALSLDATGSHDAARGFLKALLTSQIKFNDLEKANKLAQTWH